jgi:hypothetical protein
MPDEDLASISLFEFFTAIFDEDDINNITTIDDAMGGTRLSMVPVISNALAVTAQMIKDGQLSFVKSDSVTKRHVVNVTDLDNGHMN